jgi:peptidoglycan/LPS O-acetylase OafA/YrhL
MHNVIDCEHETVSDQTQHAAAATLPVPPGCWRNERISGRIEELDGLRGFAILLVIVYHYIVAISAPRYPLWTLVTQAGSLFWSGVDLFFVLSGFLIAGILLESAQSEHYFKTFYLRRVHRIFPLYFAWLALFYLALYFDVDRTYGVHIFGSAAPLWLYPLFLQNNAPLLLNAELPVWLAMSWSLAVEEQFYLVLPTIIRLFNRIRLAVISGGIIALAPMYRYLLISRHPDLNVGWAFGSFSRLDGLAWGVALALLVRNRVSWSWVTNHISQLKVAALALFGILAVLTFRPRPGMGSYVFTVVAGLYAIVVLLVICERHSLLGRLTRTRWLQYLGSVSYGVYIFHQGVRAIIEALFSQWKSVPNALHIAVVTAVSLLITALIAQLSWTFMEKRLIKLAHLRYKY